MIKNIKNYLAEVIRLPIFYISIFCTITVISAMIYFEKDNIVSAFSSLKEAITIEETTGEETDSRCIINGEYYKVSPEVCDEIKRNAKDDMKAANIATQTPVPVKKVVQPTLDPDPIIVCNVSENCGGGTQQLRQSVCNNSTCCQIGNSWIFYEDHNKCDEDQDEDQTAYNNNANPPCYVYGKTFYVPSETCIYYQNSERDSSASSIPIDTFVPNNPTPQPTIDFDAQNQRNIELRSNCIYSLSAYYREQMASVNRRRDLGLSAQQNMINSIQSEWNSAIKDCEYKYPTF